MMHDQAFDQALRGLPRRGFLAILAGLSGGAVAQSSAETRRRKRKKCKKGTKKCGKKCFDLKTSNANCGACGTACSGGQSCSDGVCGCPADQSFVAGVCIPRFGCTPDLDTCTFGKQACPVFTNESDARCYETADGQPFCGTTFECGAFSADAACPVGDGLPRIFIPCALCANPGETGACVRQISQVRP